MIAGEVLLDAFINANILFCLAYALWFGIRKTMARLGLEGTHRVQLSLLNCVFFAVVLAPVFALGLKSLQSSGVAASVNLNVSDMVVSYYLNGGFEMDAARLEGLILARDTFTLNVLTGAGWLAQAVIAIVAVSFVVGAARLFLSLMSLRRILANSFSWRRFGRVRIHLSERVVVPFSTRGLFNYYVVIPSEMLARPSELKVSLAHEFQHIRQGDLEWEILLEVLKPIFYLNPAFRAWKRQVEELREFSCDSAVLSRGYINARTYCDTLLSVCHKTLQRDPGRIVAVPKVTLVKADRLPHRTHPLSFVEHRIHSVLETRKPTNQRMLFLAISVPLFASISFISLAIQQPGDWSHDRLMLSTVVNLERLEKITQASTLGRIER